MELCPDLTLMILGKISPELSMVHRLVCREWRDLERRIVVRSYFRSFQNYVVFQGYRKLFAWTLRHLSSHEFDLPQFWAALGDHKDFLLELRSIWNSDTCFGAAASGNLELLKWLRERGCPWDELTTNAARAIDREDIAVWALLHGCPIQV